MSYLEDPRVFYAIERTFLAWLRTEIAVLALAFLIKKFSYEQITAQQISYLNLSATILCALVILMSIVSFWQCTISVNKLGPKEFPAAISKWSLYLSGIIAIALAIVMSGVVMVI